MSWKLSKRRLDVKGKPNKGKRRGATAPTPYIGSVKRKIWKKRQRGGK